MRSNFKTKTLRQSFASAAIMALAISATTAKAQDQQAAESGQESEDSSDLIVVTGSRIASPTVESAAPLQILDDAAIDDSGVTNVQELLLENPAFGTPALSRTNSAFLTSGTGVASVDLRDLGSNRTLVLVNGRRVVAGIPGTSIVDLNVIPTQFLERVDILTGGASSLYGSDAVAGVVNFVYKKDFEGIEANGQIGLTERSDDLRYQANLTFGTNVADGRGNVMVHFGYSNEDGLLSRERSNTQVDAISNIFFGGDVNEELEPFFSSFPPQGRFDVAGTPGVGDDFTFDPNGNLQPCFTTNGTTCPGGVGPNGFNRQNFRTLAVPVERYLFATVGSYEISDHVNLFFEGTYSRTESSRIIEPFALQSGGSTGIYPGTGRMPIENDVNGAVLVNPLVPADIVAAAQDTDGDGLRDIGFQRRLVEFGPRSGDTTRDFYRFVVGFDGAIFDDKFNWDVSYNFGQTSENQTSSGQVNIQSFQQALAAQADIDDIDGDGDVTEAICINADARASGCVPINIFGEGNISQDAIAFIDAQATFQTKITQQVVQGNIYGSLFDLPAGPLGIAAGVEYRREESEEDNDALTNAGLNGGNKLGDSFGEFDVLEGYLEVKVPILANTPGFELLEAGGAIRVADYSTVGTVVSYNGTLTWQPIEDIRLRGTYSRAVRAPNIDELFAGAGQTFPPGLQDPCANSGTGPNGGVTATETSALATACRAFAGVNANIAANGGEFQLVQADIQGISGFNLSNPDLEEEKADSWTVGAVINPRSIDALRNLTITVDYYNIDVSNVIAAPGRAFTLDQCFNNADAVSCSFITRRANQTSTNSAGSIEFVDAQQLNGASLKTEGIDVTASYNTGLDALGLDGKLSARVAYTHVFKNDFRQRDDQPVDPSAGEIGTSQDRFTANLGYSEGPFRIGFTGTYISSAVTDDQFCVDCGDAVDAQFYLDSQLNYKVSEEFEFYFGVDNLLDNDAPLIPTSAPFNVTGSDTAADVYDIFGRRYYTGVRMRF